MISKDTIDHYIYSTRLTPGEHEAAERLIDILLEKKILERGPRGVLSRSQFILYLIYAAIDKHKEAILSKRTEVIKQDGEEEAQTR